LQQLSGSVQKQQTRSPHTHHIPKLPPTKVIHTDFFHSPTMFPLNCHQRNSSTQVMVYTGSRALQASLLSLSLSLFHTHTLSPSPSLPLSLSLSHRVSCPAGAPLTPPCLLLEVGLRPCRRAVCHPPHSLSIPLSLTLSHSLCLSLSLNPAVSHSLTLSLSLTLSHSLIGHTGSLALQAPHSRPRVSFMRWASVSFDKRSAAWMQARHVCDAICQRVSKSSFSIALICTTRRRMLASASTNQGRVKGDLIRLRGPESLSTSGLPRGGTPDKYVTQSATPKLTCQIFT